jgi:hypothetical protein
LFSDSPSKLRGLLRFDSLPSAMNPRIGNLVLHRRCVRGLRLEGRSWGHHRELVTSQSLTKVRSGTCHWRQGKVNLLDVPIGPGRYGLHWRTEVINYVIVSDNVGDIPSLVDYLNVSFRGFDVAGVTRFVPMRKADKSVSRRSNVIARVRPGRDRSIPRNLCLWWKRSPANLLVALPPGNPSRSPSSSGNPAPAGPADIGPSAIMIGGPGKTLVRVPIPAVIRPNPVSISVGSPVF